MPALPGSDGLNATFGSAWRADGPTYDKFYAQDERRRGSAEVPYGAGWRFAGDKNATWELRWFEASKELCAFRHPGPDFVLPGGHYGGAAPITQASSWTVEVLAVVESKELLDDVLVGWGSHVEDANGVQWVRTRLQDAEISRGDGRP